jgi:deoxyribodipyrimidine photo-lyase
MAPIIVWFRQDLRLADNPALIHAVQSKRPVICLYVLDDETPKDWKWGGASRWWLHESLEALSKAIADKGGKLILRKGRGDDVVEKLAKETGAEAVVWNRCYEPFAIARDKKLKTALAEKNIDVQSFNGSLLHEPWEIKTKTGGPYHVFTPFWRAAREKPAPDKPHPVPKAIDVHKPSIASNTLSDWKLLPHKPEPDWAGGLRDMWTPGEAGAQKNLRNFLHHLGDYPEGRDHPDRDHTSRLSPHLHWGEISPRQVWHTIAMHTGNGSDKFLSELGWREFSYHLLFHNPHLPEKPLREEFTKMHWRRDERAFKAWTKGQTGIPIVDAGMRQLWQTGWMHNRVRMIVASLLIKHLLINWRHGEDWFWDTLVDADLAANAENWQWVAGCGADASPFFRIFNPVLQGEKFDSDGGYVRRYVPELAKMPNAHIHKPWEAPDDVLKKAGVTLGRDYPEPIVDLPEGRERALAAFKQLRSG